MSAPSSTIRRLVALLAILAFVAQPAAAQTVDWQPYSHPEYGYAIDLPLGLLESQGEAEGRMIFTRPDGPAQLTIYGADNPDGQTLRDIVASLEGSDGVRQVTYRKGGNSWFVISGYYQQGVEQSDELIFYVKLMMSSDLSRYAVFAINYPRSEKQRFDPVIERLEASFRPPL